MNFDLSEEHELVRQTVRNFAEQRVAPVAEELDRESRFPYELVAELAELGLMGVRRRWRRHGRLRDRGRGADARRLVGCDHSRRAPLARHAADLLLRERRAASRVASRPRVGQEAGRVRTDRGGRGLRRRRDANDGRAARRRVDRQRLQDLHHQRRDGHHRLRDDHGPHRGRRDLQHRRPERDPGLRDLCTDEEARLARFRHARHSSRCPSEPSCACRCGSLRC